MYTVSYNLQLVSVYLIWSFFIVWLLDCSFIDFFLFFCRKSTSCSLVERHQMATLRRQCKSNSLLTFICEYHVTYAPQCVKYMNLEINTLYKNNHKCSTNHFVPYHNMKIILRKAFQRCIALNTILYCAMQERKHF